MQLSTDTLKKLRIARLELIALVLILLLGFALRIVSVHEPLERDEGFYGYFGQEILRGAIPYRDIDDLKPPGIYYIYAAMVALFGNSIEGIRVVTAFYALFTTILVYLLGRRLESKRVGMWTAFLFACFSSAPLMQGNGSNAEVFMLMPLVASIYLLVLGLDSERPPHGRTCFAVSGFLAGLAMLIKTVALPYVALIFAFLVLRPGCVREWRSRLHDAVFFLAPPLAMVLIVVAYFSGHGAFDALYYWNVTIHKRYVQTNVYQCIANLKENAGYLLKEELFLWLTASVSAIWLLITGKGLKRLLMALLLPVSFVGVAMPGHYFPHYFIQLTPFCALAAGLGLSYLWRKKGWPFYLALPVLIIAFWYHVQADYRFYFVYTPDEMSTQKYDNYPIFAQSVNIARYIKERSNPDDYIVQWGFEPELYFYSNRRGFKNLCYFMSIELAPNRLVAIRNMIDDLKSKKPKYIIVQKDAENAYSSALGFRALTRAIVKDFFLEHQEGYASIYRRKPTAP